MEHATYLFTGAAFLALLGQLIHLVRVSSTRQAMTGQIPLTAISSWTVGNALIFQIQPDSAYFVMLNVACSLGMLMLFSQRFLSGHINLPSSQKSLSIITVATMVIAPFMPIPGSMIITVYSFAGILASIILLLYAERLYHVLKHNNTGNGVLVFGLAGLIITHFVTFCHLILSNQLNPHHAQWVAVSTLLMYPFIYKGVSSLSSVDVKITISRSLALHTTLSSIAGVYLLGLAGVGFIMQKWFADVSYTTNITLFGSSLFPLLYILASNRFRRETLVWLNKHFFSSQFDYRDTWRTMIKQLSPDLYGQEAARRGLHTMLSAIDHPKGAYYRFVNGSWRLAASQGKPLDENAEALLFSLADDVREDGWIVDIKELQDNPNAYKMVTTNTRPLDEQGVHWVIPVRHENKLAGLWVVAQSSKPKWELNWETRDFLQSLGQQVESYLQGQEAQQRYSESAQLAAFHRTSAFVIHDMKNIYAQLAMINKNAPKFKDRPDFIDDMLVSLGSMQGRMDKMLGQLTNKQQKGGSGTSSVSVWDLWDKMKDDNSIKKHGIHPEFVCDANEDTSVNVNAERFRNVLRHLVDNAQYACKNSEIKVVTVHCRETKNHVIITVSDTGEGMSEDFVKKQLFKPFVTTKGNAGMGLGVYDAKSFAEQHGGEMAVDSEVGQGTTVTLKLSKEQ